VFRLPAWCDNKNCSDKLDTKHPAIFVHVNNCVIIAQLYVGVYTFVAQILILLRVMYTAGNSTDSTWLTAVQTECCTYCDGKLVWLSPSHLLPNANIHFLTLCDIIFTYISIIQTRLKIKLASSTCLPQTRYHT